MKQLDSSVLHAMDLDVPKNVLLFSVVKPPHHGSIIHSSGQLVYKQREASPQSTVVEFTMTDLINGTLCMSMLKMSYSTENDWFKVRVGRLRANAAFMPYEKDYKFLHFFIWLAGNTLMYMHDDSENMDDSFTIQLTDGRHRLHRQVMVKVLPVNDEGPHVIR